jgi:hypothetical protein
MQADNFACRYKKFFSWKSAIFPSENLAGRHAVRAAERSAQSERGKSVGPQAARIQPVSMVGR